jgi:hypothetical protein
MTKYTATTIATTTYTTATTATTTASANWRHMRSKRYNKLYALKITCTIPKFSIP